MDMETQFLSFIPTDLKCSDQEETFVFIVFHSQFTQQ